MNIQSVLEKVAHQGLAASSGDEMMLLACAYWHENFIPDLSRVKDLSGAEQQIIGYLTDFFSSFSCLKLARAIELAELASSIKLDLKPINSKNTDVDEIAAEWGLNENISKFVSDILFMQTRHYIHTPWKKLSCYKALTNG